MTTRDDQETARRVVELITAYRREDYRRANELLAELMPTGEDAFMLMLMLARHNAHAAHSVHRRLDVDVNPFPADRPGAAQVALQLISMMANDQFATAYALAQATVAIGNTHPEHVQRVVTELVDLCADGGPTLIAATPAPGAEPGSMN